MFHHIREPILARMRHLEQIDAQDRVDGTPRAQRLRQIPPETGKFIALLAAGAPEGSILEVGTSAGYSSLWLSLACDLNGRILTTYELSPDKAALARETFQTAGVGHLVNQVVGDAREQLLEAEAIAFCFLDAEKEIYDACYEAVVARLVPGGLLAADNAVSHHDEMGPLLRRAMTDERVDALVVPIGKGVLVCRKI